MAALPGLNLLKEFEGVMETPSQAGGALVKLCELIPNNEDGVAIKTVLARAADHLVPRQQEVADAQQVIKATTTHVTALSNLVLRYTSSRWTGARTTTETMAPAARSSRQVSLGACLCEQLRPTSQI